MVRTHEVPRKPSRSPTASGLGPFLTTQILMLGQVSAGFSFGSKFSASVLFEISDPSVNICVVGDGPRSGGPGATHRVQADPTSPVCSTNCSLHHTSQVPLQTWSRSDEVPDTRGRPETSHLDADGDDRSLPFILHLDL